MASADMHADQLYVESIVRGMVTLPDAVRTERITDEQGVLITLYVDPSELGTIIGKEGQTAKALRTLVRVYGARQKERISVKVWEPERSRPASFYQLVDRIERDHAKCCQIQV